MLVPGQLFTSYCSRSIIGLMPIGNECIVSARICTPPPAPACKILPCDCDGAAAPLACSSNVDEEAANHSSVYKKGLIIHLKEPLGPIHTYTLHTSVSLWQRQSFSAQRNRDTRIAVRHIRYSAGLPQMVRFSVNWGAVAPYSNEWAAPKNKCGMLQLNICYRHH